MSMINKEEHEYDPIFLAGAKAELKPMMDFFNEHILAKLQKQESEEHNPRKLAEAEVKSFFDDLDEIAKRVEKEIQEINSKNDK